MHRTLDDRFAGLAVGAATGVLVFAWCAISAPDANLVRSTEPFQSTTPRTQELERVESSFARAAESPSEIAASSENSPRSDLVAALRDRIRELAATLGSEAFDPSAFDAQARAIAASSSALSEDEVSILASHQDLSRDQRVALAEILRHFPAFSATPLLATLRDAWQSRDAAPNLAAASVRALAAFGDAHDRRDLLEMASSPLTTAVERSLACAGLSAARGDEAALDLADAARTTAGCVDVALAALTVIARASDSDLTIDGRARCTNLVLGIASAQGPGSPRALAALAALDPRRAEDTLGACLADPRASSTSADCAASALATSTSAAPLLDAIVLDARLPLERRIAAAGARIACSSEPSPIAASLLEKVGDESGSAGIGIRARRYLDLARTVRLETSDPAVGSSVHGSDARILRRHIQPGN